MKNEKTETRLEITGNDWESMLLNVTVPIPNFFHALDSHPNFQI